MDSPRPDQPVALRTKRQISAVQRAFLASHVRAPASASLNMAHLVEFDQRLDPERFAEAFAHVVRSADALRTQFDFDDLTTAAVAAEPPTATEVISLPYSELGDWAHEQAARSFDLTTSCYRSVLIDHGSHSSWFVVVHHIAIDATGFQTLIERTAAAYLGETPPPSRFYAWVDALDATPDSRSTYWSRRDPLPRPGRLYQANGGAASAATRLPLGATSDDRDRFAAALAGPYRLLNPELSLAAFLLSATAVYLHRVTRADVFAIGVPVHQRTADNAALIGPTLGVYPVDIAVNVDDTFATLHKRCARALMTTLSNADPRVSAPGDYDAVVNVIPNMVPTARAQLPMTTSWVHSGAIDPEHVLRIQATQYDRPGADTAGLAIDLDVQDQVASPAQQLVAPGHLLNVLRAQAQNPEHSIYNEPITSANELAEIVAAETGADFADSPALVTDRLRTCLKDNPEVVLESGDQSLTGHQLWSWVQALAQDIHATEPENGRISIELAPTLEAVVAIYACIMAGRPFVPLDPAQPELRRVDLVRRAQITRSIRTADDVIRFADRQPSSVALPTVAADDEAYLLFTSGSTGTPKGVPISHHGLSRYIEFAVRSYFDDDVAPVAPLFTALTFDLTITTLFAPILRGGRLIALGESGPTALARFADTPEINWCKATPSHLEVLKSLLQPDHQLGSLVVGGEAFRSDLALRLLEKNPAMRIFNEYGPTEAVVGCMIHQVDPATVANDAAVPIGVPAPGVELQVVDPGGQRVPLGTAGELWIAHTGLTSGYLTPQDPSPFTETNSTRFYRSGDLVVRNEDLTLTYLGRIDEQIKVGGVRLDPSEVEAALMQHPAIDGAAVRQWSATNAHDATDIQHCVRCGLPSNVPNAVFDDQGVCSVCHAYDQVAPIAASWFGTEQDLVTRIGELTTANDSEYDCLHLMSGGKDSTYALYKLVELGFRPYALTLDNGFISQGALDNVTRAAEHLGIDHEFVTTPEMNAIFRDSLATYSDVCHGCYKTIYTLATNRAVELNIPVIVTGLSRGQLFETRLIPGQFQHDRFDPEAIDRAVVEARKRYHRAHDFPNRVLDTTVFETDDIFESLQYIDIYRYLDVELTTVLNFLEEQTPWQRPEDTGRSSNCLINIAGIHAHQVEQGYHNYAEPYAWDVRLGHKQRNESMAELDDPIDPQEIAGLLAAVGYTPKAKQVLTGWFRVNPGVEHVPTPGELRTFLADRLPVHAIPTAFVQVDELGTTANGKLDERSLPAPDREHRTSVGAYLAAETELESQIIARWEAILGLSPISANDDFFALGGDSLAAVTMAIDLGEELGIVVREELAFLHSTPRDLATALEGSSGIVTGATPAGGRTGPVARRLDDDEPSLSRSELGVLFHQASRPADAMYNIARTYTVAGPVDTDRLRHALEAAVARHEPLTWTFGSVRHRLAPADAIAFESTERPTDSATRAIQLAAWQQTHYDLEAGPLVRCGVWPTNDHQTVVALSIHHVSGDHQSLDQLWQDIDAAYQGQTLKPLQVGYRDFIDWQTEADDDHRSFWDQATDYPERPTFGTPDGRDGFVTNRGLVTPSQLRAAAGRTAVANAVGAAAAAVAPYFGSEQVEVNLVSSTRDHPSAQALVGYLLNPLPIRLSVAATESIASLAATASQASAPALAHRAYPFAQIIADARARGVRAPSGSVLVSYSDDPPAALAGVPAEQHMLFNGHAVADVSFFVELRVDHVSLGVEYSGDVTNQATAQLLLDRFDHALLAAVTADSLSVADLPAPVTSVLRGGSLSHDGLILDQLATTAANAIAIEVGERSLTHGQLVARASQLAAHLGAAGVGAGDRVTVRLPRSPELLVGIVAVQLAGASYVPIDPTYPTERIASTRETSGASIELAADTDATIETIVVTVDGFNGLDWNDATEPLSPKAAADDEAYVIFTSGSTGTANGVPITHRQLANSTYARRDFYEISPNRFLMLSSVAFDSSIVGIFWCLATGATLILPTEDIAHDLDAVGELFSSARPSHVLCVPTLYDAVLERTTTDVSSAATSWPSHIIVAGEACPRRLVDQHFALVPASKLTNEYGPTEATVWATAHHCSRHGVGLVPIGRPISGTWTAVVDESLTVRPAGVPGELIIGGPNIAAGYLGARSDRFITTAHIGNLPADLSGGIFRTGDKCAVVDGTVEFLGRIDDQLNVGGARVEPAEIEAALMTVDAISNAVVVGNDIRSIDQILAEASQEATAQAMRNASQAADPTAALRRELADIGRPDTRLVAHVTGPDSIDREQLRRSVAHLPSTHRPTIFQLHEALPQLPNGKVDRAAVAALPVQLHTLDPAQGADDGTSLAVVRRLFAETLQCDVVDDHQSFFDMGGDSLRALMLLRQIETQTGIRLPTSAIHNAPTPAELAAVLAEHGGAAVAQSEQPVDNTIVMHLQPNGDAPPIFALHNLGVDGAMWRPMSGHLGNDQPLYGIADPFALLDPFGDSYNLEHRPEIHETAAQYVRHIQELAPTGPIVLLGFCLGGVVGYDVAQQLQAQGRDVQNFIIVLDWHAPHLEYEENWITLTKLSYRRSGNTPVAYVRGLLARRAFLKSARRRLEGYAVRAAIRFRLPLSERLRARQYVEEGIHRIHSYEYLPYDGRITVVRSTDDPRIPTDLGNRGWGDLVTDLEVEYVAGVGEKMLHEPHIAAVTEVVQRALVPRDAVSSKRSRDRS